MSLRLALGVVEIPYSHDPKEIRERKSAKNIKKARRARPETFENMTTGDVATILESRYHPMEIFAEVHKEFISNAVADGLAGALENMIMGAPVSMRAFAGAESAIAARFKQFLSNKEMDSLGYPGVPTKAALDGVSHRFKHPYAKRPARPSFIDTGLYQASMFAEVKS